VLGDWLPLVIEWDYGAFAALGAAIISLAVAIAAIRDAPRRQRMPGY
jgi:ABC-type multidrug transport system permease subunit